MAEKGRILIVEDDRDIRENLEMLLEGEGYLVWTSANGQVALDLLHTEKSPPSLIFLDLMMPIMDGREFLAAKEADAKLTDVPVVVITAAAETFHNKIVGFMRKPLDVDQVLFMAAKYAAV